MLSADHLVQQVMESYSYERLRHLESQSHQRAVKRRMSTLFNENQEAVALVGVAYIMYGVLICYITAAVQSNILFGIIGSVVCLSVGFGAIVVGTVAARRHWYNHVRQTTQTYPITKLTTTVSRNPVSAVVTTTLTIESETMVVDQCAMSALAEGITDYQIQYQRRNEEALAQLRYWRKQTQSLSHQQCERIQPMTTVPLDEGSVHETPTFKIIA